MRSLAMRLHVSFTSRGPDCPRRSARRRRRPRCADRAPRDRGRCCSRGARCRRRRAPPRTPSARRRSRRGSRGAASLEVMAGQLGVIGRPRRAWQDHQHPRCEAERDEAMHRQHRTSDDGLPATLRAQRDPSCAAWSLFSRSRSRPAARGRSRLCRGRRGRRPPRRRGRAGDEQHPRAPTTPARPRCAGCHADEYAAWRARRCTS